MIDPFKTADKYIELKKQCMPPSWGDAMIRMNEMLVAPLIAIFLAFLGKGDIMMIVSAAMTAHRVWTEWLEFQDLRFKVQRMYLVSSMLGGPFIRTNDPEYEAYVYADAIVRAQTGMLKMSATRQRPVSAQTRPPVG